MKGKGDSSNGTSEIEDEKSDLEIDLESFSKVGEEQENHLLMKMYGLNLDGELRGGNRAVIEREGGEQNEFKDWKERMSSRYSKSSKSIRDGTTTPRGETGSRRASLETIRSDNLTPKISDKKELEIENEELQGEEADDESLRRKKKSNGLVVLLLSFSNRSHL